jgi:hypothetical protein
MLLARRPVFRKFSTPVSKIDFVEPGASEGRIVLNSISEQIRECLQHADGRKAAIFGRPFLSI